MGKKSYNLFADNVKRCGSCPFYDDGYCTEIGDQIPDENEIYVECTLPDEGDNSMFEDESREEIKKLRAELAEANAEIERLQKVIDELIDQNSCHAVTRRVGDESNTK